MVINTSSIAHIRFTVTDIARSREFYESVFNWPINIEMPEDADDETREGSHSCSLAPFLLVVPFTAIINGLFNLSDSLSVPLALVVGAGWGIFIGLVAS